VCKIHFSTSWCERVDLFILWLGSNARFILALSAHSRFFKFILANNCLSFNNLVPASFIAISCVRSIKIPRYARIVTCVTPSIVLFSRRIVAIPSAYNPHSELTLSTVGVIWKIMRGFTCGLRMLHFRLKSNSGKKEALMHIYIYIYINAINLNSLSRKTAMQFFPSYYQKNFEFMHVTRKIRLFIIITYRYWTICIMKIWKFIYKN